MCEVCGQYVCPSSCPSFDGYIVGLGDPCGECSVCESRLYDDEATFSYDGKTVCAECAGELVSPELLSFLGCADIKDFFEMLP